MSPIRPIRPVLLVQGPATRMRLPRGRGEPIRDAMRLYSIEADGRRVGVWSGPDGFWDLTALLHRLNIDTDDGVLGLIRADDAARAEVLAAAREVAGRGAAQVGEAARLPHIPARAARVLAPLRRPGKIMCIGRNYLDHCKEQNVEPPKEPTLFAKWGSCIVGPGDAIVHPTVTEQLDYEVELVAVIGRRARNVGRADALAHVFGYTAANDVTARDLQKRDGQWTRAKSCDTFCPLGPCVVTADAIADPQRLAVRTWVDGESRQDSNTEQMIFSVAVLIEFLSRAFTLEPGDLLLTGTPPGVGAHRNPPGLLRPGQTVRIEIEHIGTFENPVVAAG